MNWKLNLRNFSPVMTFTHAHWMLNWRFCAKKKSHSLSARKVKLFNFLFLQNPLAKKKSSAHDSYSWKFFRAQKYSVKINLTVDDRKIHDKQPTCLKNILCFHRQWFQASWNKIKDKSKTFTKYWLLLLPHYHRCWLTFTCVLETKDWILSRPYPTFSRVRVKH